MKYISLIIIMVLLFIGSLSADLQKILPWLLGINFSIALFSVNFTFFGYQLSKYKPIYNKITKRQWFNIIILLSLPFLPLIIFLIIPVFFNKIALLIMPIMVFSSIDNALLTINYLSPKKFIKNVINDKVVSQYIDALVKTLKIELEEHKRYIDEKAKFQLPMHAFHFEPVILGLETTDIWDSISIVSILSIDNNDYPIFRKSLNAILNMIVKFNSYKINKGKSYEIEDGLRLIARKRFRSIIVSVSEKDKSGLFFQSLSNEMCNFLLKEDVQNNPCSPMTRSFCSDAIWIGIKMLESKSIIQPIMILNTIHRIAEVNIYSMENADQKEIKNNLDKYNISIYANDIKELGVAALNNGNSHFAYRCMESLSYLGCNSAKVKSDQTIVTVLESIVHLGRVARNLKIGCFWDRCLIPAESHAEEFMGHILTWLVRDMKPDGNFYMKGYAEQAYSRIRGIKCKIEPELRFNPCFWIKEIESDGKKHPHIEEECGMYGYCGKIDYSDFTNLKEYVLYGIGSDSSSTIFHTPPMPLNVDTENSEGNNNDIEDT